MLQADLHQQLLTRRAHAVIAQTVTNIVVAAEAEAERTQHEPYLVGVSVFVVLTLMLLATLSFNRNK
jgi:hypothetical protein